MYDNNPEKLDPRQLQAEVINHQSHEINLNIADLDRVLGPLNPEVNVVAQSLLETSKVPTNTNVYQLNPRTPQIETSDHMDIERVRAVVDQARKAA